MPSKMHYQQRMRQTLLYITIESLERGDRH